MKTKLSIHDKKIIKILCKNLESIEMVRKKFRQATGRKIYPSDIKKVLNK
ncbi:MAG: hypothetical protein U9P90_01085 [Patescibacteria group bacterium]|nr:hypothetical protein [Patescibacteria group bacterium]